MPSQGDFENITINEDQGDYTYRKLRPNEDRSCTEEVLQLDRKNIFNSLFPIMVGKRLQIFCICIHDDAGVSKDKIYRKINELWKREMFRRKQNNERGGKERVPDNNCEEDLGAINNFEEFKICLAGNMVQRGCINVKDMADFYAFLTQPNAEPPKDFFQGAEDADIVFVYFISEDIYATLKEKYSLPLKASSVIKLFPNTIMPTEKANGLYRKIEKLEDEKRNYKKALDILFDYIKKEKDLDNDFLDDLFKDVHLNKSNQLFKVSDKTSSYEDDILFIGFGGMEPD